MTRGMIRGDQEKLRAMIRGDQERLKAQDKHRGMIRVTKKGIGLLIRP